MNSFEVYKRRNNRRLTLEADFSEASETAAHALFKAEALRKSLDFERDKVKRLEFGLYGDRSVETRVVAKRLEIDDRAWGEIPCLSVRFKRLAFVGNSYRNNSFYECHLVLPRNAVFTRMQGEVIFNAIREVLDFATKGSNDGE